MLTLLLLYVLVPFVQVHVNDNNDDVLCCYRDLRLVTAELWRYLSTIGFSRRSFLPTFTAWTRSVKTNTHRRHDATVELSCVGIGGVNIIRNRN